MYWRGEHYMNHSLYYRVKIRKLQIRRPVNVMESRGEHYMNHNLYNRQNNNNKKSKKDDNVT